MMFPSKGTLVLQVLAASPSTATLSVIEQFDATKLRIVSYETGAEMPRFRLDALHLAVPFVDKRRYLQPQTEAEADSRVWALTPNGDGSFSAQYSLATVCGGVPTDKGGAQYLDDSDLIHVRYEHRPNEDFSLPMF